MKRVNPYTNLYQTSECLYEGLVVPHVACRIRKQCTPSLSGRFSTWNLSLLIIPLMTRNNISQIYLVNDEWTLRSCNLHFCQYKGCQSIRSQIRNWQSECRNRGASGPIVREASFRGHFLSSSHRAVPLEESHPSLQTRPLVLHAQHR